MILKGVSGQGALDYLLLVGGAVLVTTVVMIIILQGTIPQGETILNSALNQYSGVSDDSLGGGGGGGNGGSNPCPDGGNLLKSTYTFTTQNDVAYYSDGDADHFMDIYTPVEVAGPYPAMIVIHGGDWVIGDEQGTDASSASERFASFGLKVFSINFQSDSAASSFPQDIKDVVCAIRKIKSTSSYNIENSRIGLFGMDSGGHLASLAASIPSNDDLLTGFCNPLVDHSVSLVINEAGPGDLRTVGESAFGGWPVSRFTVWLGCPYSGLGACPSTWLEASPAEYISTGDPPVVIGQGSDDPINPKEFSIAYKDKLIAGGVTASLVLVGSLADHFTHTTSYIDPTNTAVRCVAEQKIKEILQPGAEYEYP